MNNRFIAFFSGFPDRCFPLDIAGRLEKELTRRDSLVFISAWPDDSARNDEDSDGMHGMFAACGIPFARHQVIDSRMEAAQAQRLVREASCIFLMGGHPEQQRKLLTDLRLDDAIRGAQAAVLGVSAGSINMARRSLDTKESPVPYEGLGLANITIKPHFSLDHQDVLSTLLTISKELPICATEDNSAIFIANGDVSFVGRIHFVNQGTLAPLTQEDLIGLTN